MNRHGLRARFVLIDFLLTRFHSLDSERHTGRFRRGNGEYCKRIVPAGEGLCWQHAKSWSHKWRALPPVGRFLSYLFFTALLGFLSLAGLCIPHVSLEPD